MSIPLTTQCVRWKSPLVVIADACDAHAAKLRTVHVDGVPGTLPAATIADLIITLERASAGLR